MLDDLHVTQHALDAYRIHYPAAEMADLRADLDRAEEIPAAVAAPLCGKTVSMTRGSRYRLSCGRRGLFAISGVSGKVQTYLRFQRSQEEFARAHYPAVPDWIPPGEAPAPEEQPVEAQPAEPSQPEFPPGPASGVSDTAWRSITKSSMRQLQIDGVPVSAFRVSAGLRGLLDTRYEGKHVLNARRMLVHAMSQGGHTLRDGLELQVDDVTFVVHLDGNEWRLYAPGEDRVDPNSPEGDGLPLQAGFGQGAPVERRRPEPAHEPALIHGTLDRLGVPPHAELAWRLGWLEGTVLARLPGGLDPAVRGEIPG